MACRQTGFAILMSSTVQEAHDNALISQAVTLASRVPFLHVFDGFRTSHEINKIEEISDDVVRALIGQDLVDAHKERSLTPDRPSIRGTAQNPDVFFQAREACSPYYKNVPSIFHEVLAKFSQLTGRAYKPFDYFGHPQAEDVIIAMGSAVGAIKQCVCERVKQGDRVGLVQVRLYRPFDYKMFVDVLPKSVKNIAVLDRTKEPGSLGEPLYLDVVASVSEAKRLNRDFPVPCVIGGRYGLSSKEFTPNMVLGVFSEMRKDVLRHGFTVGIYDDVSHSSIPWDTTPEVESEDTYRAVFYGLGSDGTVGANKNSVKIIGETTDLFAQGYFVYDSKKSGSKTVSHLRFSPNPIESPYLIQEAQFVGCHQFSFVQNKEVLKLVKTNGVFLLNSPYSKTEVWDRLPKEIQQQIIDKSLKFYVVDAYKVARDAGLGSRINTVMQMCFLYLSQIIDVNKARSAIIDSITKTYGKRGRTVVEANISAVDSSIENLQQVMVPKEVTSRYMQQLAWAQSDSDFVNRVTSMIAADRGDLLAVSVFPPDGTYPSATSKYEKRSIGTKIPIWNSDICIQCAWCSMVCPHAAIRTKAFSVDELKDSPEYYKAITYKGKELQGDNLKFTVQVAPDDCTGCGVCVDVCPAKSKSMTKDKAINMRSKQEHLHEQRDNFDFFLTIKDPDKSKVALDTVRGSQLVRPLFEFSGACAGCGETPYLKLLSQLFGDRAFIANATGCSSIYGGNLPTTPWSKDQNGRGPAWANSLFEDNAEFGLGMELAVAQKQNLALKLLNDLEPYVGSSFVHDFEREVGRDDKSIERLRERNIELIKQLDNLLDTKSDGVDLATVRQLRGIAEYLVPKSVWIVGGDGWGYDIGFGGIDHVLASGRNVNILVLDTEVYSNTGGQASKATPRGAVAKFASAGKTARKKDLGIVAMNYGQVYVAQIALGANMSHALNAMIEAESYPGTSLIIAYSSCIAHGIDMTKSMSQMKYAEAVGYWPLYRFDPRRPHPFILDSKRKTKQFKDFAMSEARYAMLHRSHPERFEQLVEAAQSDIDERWRHYEKLSELE